MNQKKTIVRTFTDGSIPRQLMLFMLPVMASNAFQVLYSAVDMIVVGQYVGKTGLAAVSQCGQMMNLFTMIVTGLCTGGQVLISQFIGAGRKKELNDTIGTLFSFILLIGLGASVFVLLLHHQILQLIHMPSESMGMGVGYLEICGAGLVFSFGYNMVSAVLRGMGDSRHPFYFITLASVLNLLLDLLFTGYWGWGVPGAAAATVIGQAVSFLFALQFLYIHRETFGFDFRRKSWRVRKIYLEPMIEQGIPVAISSSTVYFSMFYVQRLINMAGVTAAATFGVGIKIDDICNKISAAIRYAATPMIGQNWAVKDIRRVKSIVRWSWFYAMLFHVAFMILYLVLGRQAFMLFTSDPEVLALAPVFIRSIIWTFIPMAIMRGNNALVQGIGNARFSMLLGLLDGVFCRIGLSYLFGVILDYGFAGLVFGYGLAPFGSILPSSVYILSGIWTKRKALVDEIPEVKQV